MRGPVTFQRPMTVFWSRAHRERHVTICLMKFAVGERNVAIRYIYFVLGCVIWIWLSYLIQPDERLQTIVKASFKSFGTGSGRSSQCKKVNLLELNDISLPQSTEHWSRPTFPEVIQPYYICQKKNLPKRDKDVAAIYFGTFDFFLVLMRWWASRTTADLKMKTIVRISTVFLILPSASLALSHLTVPYICSSDTLRFTACRCVFNAPSSNQLGIQRVQSTR